MDKQITNLISEKTPGVLSFGQARMAFIDIESGFWSIRRQIEALIGAQLTNSVMQQAGANGGASFAASFANGETTAHQSEAFQSCLQAYQIAGFGNFTIEDLSWPIGRAMIHAKDTFEAWMMLHHAQQVESPVCAYTAGVLVGFVNMISDRRDVVCIERHCQALGDEFCEFELLPSSEYDGPSVVSLSPDPKLGRQINLLEMLFERMPMGIAVIDRDYKLVRCNPTWAAFIDRYTPSKMFQVVPGAAIFKLEPGAEDELIPLFERVFSGETIRQDAVRIESGGIESFWDIVLSPLYEDEKIVGLLNVSIDATERVSVHQTLERRVQERTAEVERRREAAESLQDIIGMINSNLPLNIFLESAIKLAAQRLGAAGCALHQFDLENKLITQMAHYGMEGIFLRGRTRSFRSLRPSGGEDYLNATLEKQPTYHNYPPLPERLDEIRRDDSIPEAIKKERIALRSRYAGSFSVPLFIQDQPYGGLVFYYSEPQEFSDEQIQLGMTFAEQMAVAIENARLLQEAEQRRKVAESLVEVLAVLNSSRTDQEIFDFLTKRSCELLSAEACMLYRIDDGVIFQLSQYNLPESIDALKTGALYPGVKNQELIQRQPVLITDIGQYLRDLLQKPDLQDFQRLWYENILENFKAYLGIPMIVSEELFGGLVFYYKQNKAFKTEDVQLAEVMAGHVSLAIENAMLRTQTAEIAAISERNRLARDLHDAVSQTLFSASLIAEVLPKLWARNPEAGRQKLDELRLLTRGALSEMRTLLLELRPGTLSEMDLGDLYRHLANAFTGRNRLMVELSVDGQIELPADVKEVFYRIAQEALNNVSKHANAARVEMTLARADNQVILKVQDYGRGFVTNEISPQSMGLKIMQERADSIGARLLVQSTPETGTCINLNWKDVQS